MSDPTPDEKVDGLFRLFTAYYGHDKVAAMWRGSDLRTVRAVWRDSLAQFDGTVLRAAVDRLREIGSDFPPSLPSFTALCIESAKALRDAARRQADFNALPAPLQADPEQAHALATVARTALAQKRPTLEWARMIVDGRRPNASPIARIRAAEALAAAGEATDAGAA